MTVIPMSEQRSPSQELVEWVRSDERRNQIAQALPEGVSIDRFERATATALVANPDLATLDRASLYLSILRAAQLGLVPDGRQAAIVPFGKNAQLIVMIGGVRDTLAEYGWMLKTGTVRFNDEFEMDEAAGSVRHPLRVGDDRGEIIGFYAVAIHRDGRQRMGTWMSVAEVNEVRDKMGVANNPAWKKWYAQMGEKTIGHRLADDVPLAPQDRRRVEWILNATELPAEDAAAALYGENARATFAELPSGHGPTQEPASEIVDADPPVGDSPGGDGDPPQEASSAQPADSPDAAAPTPLPEPDEEAVMLAADAAGFVPPSGKYAENGDEGPKTLAEILADGDDGRKYLAMLLRQLGEGEWREKTEAFARVHMPEEYAATLAAREPKAA